MEAYALDKDFNLVTYGIPYDNLQWSRRYYTFGSFAMQIPMVSFDSSWSYIGIIGRDELGMVQKVVYQGQSTVMVSGFFCEKMLDDAVCYPRYIGSAKTTEEAARAIFSKYKGKLPVELGAIGTPALGEAVQSDFVDDALGEKLYSLLEASGLSYRVRYDYAENKLLFEVWQGLNRTQDQTVNSTQVFSADFGNLGDRTVNLDESAYKNYAIVPYDADDLGVEKKVMYIDLTNGEARRDVLLNMRSMHPEDRQTYAEFEAAVRQSATERMADYSKVEEVDVEMLSDKGYMDDYDLGDMCDIYFRDLDMTMQARIIEVNEVFKKEGHEITVGLGNKRISRIRRAVLGR